MKVDGYKDYTTEELNYILNSILPSLPKDIVTYMGSYGIIFARA